MPSSTRLLVPITLWATAAVNAQQAKPAVSEGTIHVEITALVSDADATGGSANSSPANQKQTKQKPSEQKPAGKTGKRRREVVWTVAKTPCRSLADAKQRLDRAAANPANMVPDPKTGGRKLASVTIQPGPNVHWREVVGTYDSVMAAGFTVAIVHGVDTRMLTPVAIAKPTIDKQSLDVPGAFFCNPDVGAPKLRPTIDVLRDGRIRVGDKQVFAPRKGQAPELGPLRKELRRLRASMKLARELGERPGHEGVWIDMPVLLRIDRDARWQETQHLLKELQHPEVGFWKLHLAVAEKSSRLRRTGR